MVKKTDKDFQSYLLFIHLDRGKRIQIGKLGNYFFLKGFYVYTGSAIKNIEHRIKRHQTKKEKLFWHIDYLLNDFYAKIVSVRKSKLKECDLHISIRGLPFLPGFGSSDCKFNCISHLKFLGTTFSLPVVEN